jgi:TonB family protein
MRKTTFVRTPSCGIDLICLVALCMVYLPTFAQNATPVAAPTEAQATATATATAKDAPAAAMPSDPKELMLLAAKSNGLTGDDVKPWHVKATYQLLDEAGNVKDQGTYEEFWVSPAKYKRTFTGKAFAQTDYGTEKSVLRSGSQDELPHTITEIHAEIVSPLLKVKAVESESFVAQKRTMGGVKLTCLNMKDGGGSAFGTTWCIESDKPILRIDATPQGAQNLHNRIVSFRGSYIAGDLQFFQQGKQILSAHLDSIESMPTIDEALFLPPIGAVRLPRRMNVSGKAMVGLILKKVAPEYPPIAKAAQVQGTVVLQAVIGTNGGIENLRVISGPPMLQQAALDAVRQWVYKPFLLDGEPVEVETQISVFFTLPPQWR